MNEKQMHQSCSFIPNLYEIPVCSVGTIYNIIIDTMIWNNFQIEVQIRKITQKIG